MNVITVKETGRRPYLYADCTCGYSGSTVCERKIADQDVADHRRYHTTHHS
jgi:hypothetical protein